MTDQTTPMKQDPMVTELFDSELGQNIESSIMRSHSEFCLSTDNCNCNELMDKFKQKVSQLLLQKEQEVREEMQSEIRKAKEEEREKVEGEIYNELVKISDKSYGVLKMLDVAQYILLDRRGVK